MTGSQKIANALSLLIVSVTGLLLLRKRDTLADAAESGGSVVTTTPASSTPNPSGLTRGLRNNNPLNIEYTSTVWQGEIRPSTDSRFAQFQSMPYGYRAAFKTIRTYITKYGLNTVEKIIRRWDPGSTNYVNVVCQYSGLKPDSVVTTTDTDTLTRLVSAMSRMENGVAANMQDINAGLRLAQS